MNFQDIADSWWHKRSEAQLHPLIDRLFGRPREWFNACRRWLGGGPSPDDAERKGAIDDFLAWCDEHFHTDYVSRTARRHILCTKVAASARAGDLGSSDKTRLERAAHRLLQDAAVAIDPTRRPPKLDAVVERFLEAWQTTDPGCAGRRAERAFSLLRGVVGAQPDFPVAFLGEITELLACREDDHGRATAREPVNSVAAYFATAPLIRSSMKQGRDRLFRFSLQALRGRERASAALREIEGRPVQRDVFIAPRQAFVLYDDSFRRALKEAEMATDALLEAERERGSHGPPKFADCDLRVRVENSSGDLVHEALHGSSAGGAAAWGLWFAITGLVPDDGIIVLAEARGGQFHRVGGVKEKVEAIVRDGRFDTIVVADKKNCKEANDTLRALGRADVIRVKPDESEL